MSETAEKEFYPEVRGVSNEITQLRDVSSNTNQRQSSAIYGFIQSGATLVRKSDSILSLNRNETKESSSVRSSSPDPNGGDDDAEKCKSASSEPTTVATPSVLYEPVLLSELADTKHTQLVANSLIKFKSSCSGAVNGSMSLCPIRIKQLNDLATSCSPTSPQALVRQEIEHSCLPHPDIEILMKREDLHSKGISSGITIPTDVAPLVFSKLSSLFSRQECIFESIAMLEMTLNLNKTEHSQPDQSCEKYDGARSSLVRSDSGIPSVVNEHGIYIETKITQTLNDEMPCTLASTALQVVERHDMTPDAEYRVFTSSLESSASNQNNDTDQDKDAQGFESDMDDAFAMTIPPTEVISTRSLHQRGSSRRALQSCLTRVMPPVLSRCPISTEMPISSGAFSYPSSYLFRANRSGILGLSGTRRTHSAPSRLSSSSRKESHDLCEDKDTSIGCSGKIKIPTIDCKRVWYNHLKSMLRGSSEGTMMELRDMPSTSFIVSEAQPYGFFHNDDSNGALSGTSIVVSSPSRPPSTERVSCVTSSIFSFPPSARGLLRSTSTIVSATVTPRSHSNSQSLRLPSLAHLSPRFSPRLCVSEIEKQKGLYRLFPPPPHETTSPSPPSPGVALKSLSPEAVISTPDNTQNTNFISPMSAVIPVLSTSDDTCIYPNSSSAFCFSLDPLPAEAPEPGRNTSPLPHVNTENLDCNSYPSDSCSGDMDRYYAPCHEEKRENPIDASTQSFTALGSVRTKPENACGEHMPPLDRSEISLSSTFKVEEGDAGGSATVSYIEAYSEGVLGCVIRSNRQDEKLHELPEAVSHTAVFPPPKSVVAQGIPPVPVMRRPPIVPRMSLFPGSKGFASSESMRAEGATAATTVRLDGPGVVEENEAETSYPSQTIKQTKLSGWSDYELLHQLEHLPPAWRDLSPFPDTEHDVEVHAHCLSQDSTCTEAVETSEGLLAWLKEGGTGSDEPDNLRTCCNGEVFFTGEDAMGWGMPGNADTPKGCANNSATTHQQGLPRGDRISPEGPPTRLCEANPIASLPALFSPTLLISTLSSRMDLLSGLQKDCPTEFEGVPRSLLNGQDLPDCLGGGVQPLDLSRRRGTLKNSDGIFDFPHVGEEPSQETFKDSTPQTALGDVEPQVGGGSVDSPISVAASTRDESDNDNPGVSSLEWNVSDRLAELERFRAYNQEAMLLVRDGKYSLKSSMRGYTRTLSGISSVESIEGDRSDGSSPESQISLFRREGSSLRSTLRRRLREQQKLQ
ncbi:unnamed protein product [Phytomonas sp. EM1]|nr:unnamed protein product [Phytomonas sp. EM1]|eukprot:CCW62875.1 unnamed protein product [Phytomonas sp. isolate EM1]